MLRHFRAAWDVDDLTPKIAEEVTVKLPGFIEGWRQHPAFNSHLRTLETAADHFTKGDFLSASGLLFPRIEGLMRSNHSATGSTVQANQKNLAATAVEARRGRPACLLLPHKFEHYLNEVYFANFNPNDAQIGAGRNSVGHGVVSESELNQKASVIRLLVVQQLFFCFRRPQPAETATVALLPRDELSGAPKHGSAAG